ncbi:uncharacterized protein LOC128234126 [Mya arenaria]|uniref:uncharacterized protein LOC128234126 n=1 Tax=Mya arenaria TaxID=6604 RepID=UPI0022E239D1|nr:uncharacterized protein LOC128234126 [Mya arenaria]
MDASFYVILCCLVLVGEGLLLPNSCGTLTVMKPTFMNRNVTLKFVAQHRWISNIVWKYALEFGAGLQTLYGLEERSTFDDGVYYDTMSFVAYKHCNNSKFHVQCSHENITSNTVKLHLQEISPNCGNLVLLSPEVKYGKHVAIGYYPPDTLVKENDLYHERTWLNGLEHPVHLRNDTYKERKMSDYLYTLNIYNFTESKAGRYALKCDESIVSSTNWLHKHATDKQLIGPIRDECVYGNANTTIYCNTSRTTGKTHVTLSIGSEAITMTEDESQPGLYAVGLDVNTWRDHDGDIVTCNVSNDNYIHDQKSSAKLFYMEKGSDPILNMPEYIHDENTTVSCEVSNARPPASIEILVDNQAIIEAVKSDILDETSKPFACKASILKIDKNWNGKEICCRKNSVFNGLLEATCKTLNIKLLTQPLTFSLDEVQNSTPYFDSTTGETDLKGSSMNKIRANGLCNGTKCGSSTNIATKGGIKKEKPTNSRENGTKFRQEYMSAASDNSTRSFKFSLEPILIGTVAFVVLCIFVASARTLAPWLKGRSRTSDPGKAEVTSAIEATHSHDTNEYVDMPEGSMHMNAAHDFEDNYVELKIREDSMMARKPITAMKSKHAKSSLIYADLDINHLQKACVGPIPEPRPKRQNEATVYQDINFSNTRPAVPH